MAIEVGMRWPHDWSSLKWLIIWEYSKQDWTSVHLDLCTWPYLAADQVMKNTVSVFKMQPGLTCDACMVSPGQFILTLLFPTLHFLVSGSVYKKKPVPNMSGPSQLADSLSGLWIVYTLLSLVWMMVPTDWVTQIVSKVGQVKES